MPGPFNVSILSGFAVSSAFTVDRPAGALAVLVPSMTPSNLQIEFAASSGATFGVLTRGDGSGAPFSVASASGPATGWVPVVPTQWARLSTAPTNQADTRSFVVVTVQRYP